MELNLMPTELIPAQERVTAADRTPVKPQDPASPQEPAPSVDAIFAELDSLVGLKKVKETMRLVQARVALEKGDRSKVPALHSLFLGGPGTGKTTVARMLGRLLNSMGATDTEKVVLAGRDNMVGGFIGKTASLTQERIDQAKGGVLFIDEAYNLVNPDSPQDYGHEAVATLVAHMQDDQKDPVVVAAGYPAKMDNFIRSNAGIERRFRYKFYFDDYKPAELMQIFDSMLKQKGYPIEEPARAMVGNEFKARYEIRDEKFGNAGMVSNFIADAVDNLALRVVSANTVERKLMLQDVEPLCASVPREPRPVEEIMADLNKLIGLRKLKAQILRLVELVKFERRLALEAGTGFAMPSLHSLFLGSPGTGKTTVARLMGEIYRNLGLLPRGHTIVADNRGMFIGEYLGQTVGKVTKLVQSAMGGVLFIDEAYNIVLDHHDSYGREAVGVLLTETEAKGSQFVLIAAGYEDEMERFLDANSGLRSRFSDDFRFYFEDYSAEELCEIFEVLALKKGRVLGAGVREALLTEFMQAWSERKRGFGNGRAVRNYFDAVRSRVAERVNRLGAGTPLDVLKTIEAVDLTGIKLDRGGSKKD